MGRMDFLGRSLPLLDNFHHCRIWGHVDSDARRKTVGNHPHLSRCCLASHHTTRIVTLQNQRKRQLQQKEMMEKSLNVELIKSLDKDGGGVDKLEFVAQMLITLGAELCGTALQWSDVEPFIAKFDALDVDKSVRLTATDLERMVQLDMEKRERKKAEKAAAKKSKIAKA